jgi:hypothetical protein
MKKMDKDPDILEEYDFSSGTKGKYAERYAEGANVVVIDPDVASYFPDHDSVNDALRHMAAVIQKQSGNRTTASGDDSIESRKTG